MQIHRPTSPVAAQSQAQPFGTPMADSVVGDGNFAAFMGAETSALPERPSLKTLKGQGTGPGNMIAKTDSADAHGLLARSGQSADEATSDIDRFGEDRVEAEGEPLAPSWMGDLKPDAQTMAIEPQGTAADVLAGATIRPESAGRQNLRDHDPFTGLNPPTSAGEPEASVDASMGGNTPPPQQSQSDSGISWVGETGQRPEPYLAIVAQSGVDSTLLKAGGVFTHSVDRSPDVNQGGLKAASAPEDAALQTDAPASRESLQTIAAQRPMTGSSFPNPADAAIPDKGPTPGPTVEEAPRFTGQGAMPSLGTGMATKLPDTWGQSHWRPPIGEPKHQGGSHRADFDHRPSQDLPVLSVSNQLTPQHTSPLEPFQASLAAVEQPLKRVPSLLPQEDQTLLSRVMAEDVLQRPVPQRIDPAGMSSASSLAVRNASGSTAASVDPETHDVSVRAQTGQPVARTMPQGADLMEMAPPLPAPNSGAPRVSGKDGATEPFRERSFATAFKLHAADDVAGKMAAAPSIGADGVAEVPRGSAANPSKAIAAQGSTPVPAKTAAAIPTEVVDRQQPSDLLNNRAEGARQTQTAQSVVFDHVPSVAAMVVGRSTLPKPTKEYGVSGGRQEVTLGAPKGADGRAETNSAAETRQPPPPHQIVGQTNPQPSADVGPAVPVLVPITDHSMQVSSPDPEPRERESAITTGNGSAALHPIFPHSMTSQIAPRHLLAQVSQGLQAFVRQETADQVNLTLSPEELGQVQFEMTTKGDRLHINLFVERGETMELLRRNVDQLLGELRQSGLGQPSLSFGNWSHREQAKAAPAASSDASDPSEAPKTPSLPHPRLIAADGRLDLRL